MPKLSRSPATASILAVALVAVAAGCTLVSTASPDDGDVFDAPLPGLSADELAAFARGDEEFERELEMAKQAGASLPEESALADGHEE